MMARRIVIFGAGAVGGYVGAHLAQQGHDVTLVDFWHDHIEAIRARGLEISGLTAEERRSSFMVTTTRSSALKFAILGDHRAPHARREEVRGRVA